MVESVAVLETELAVVPSAPEQAEEVARTEVTHRGYKNTRVSVTIIKRHQGQATEHIHSFDITNPSFEKEILSELIA